MPTPNPPSGPLHGKDGTMMRKGSAGRISLPTQSEFDPYNDDRSNPSGIDDLPGGGSDAYDPS